MITFDDVILCFESRPLQSLYVSFIVHVSNIFSTSSSYFPTYVQYMYTHFDHLAITMTQCTLSIPFLLEVFVLV